MQPEPRLSVPSFLALAAPALPLNDLHLGDSPESGPHGSRVNSLKGERGGAAIFSLLPFPQREPPRSAFGNKSPLGGSSEEAPGKLIWQ